MNRDPILMRVDATPDKGFERLARCQIFAMALQRRRRPTYFVSQLEPRSLALNVKRGGNNWLEADLPGRDSRRSARFDPGSPPPQSRGRDRR